MTSVFKSLDIFKVVPDPTLQGNRGLHSSKIGQSLTIMLFLSGLSLLVYFSLDMIKKTNPRVQTTDAVRSVDMILNNQSFPFTIGVMGNNSKFYVDERVYNIKAFYTTTNRKVNLVRCDPNTPTFNISGPEAAGLFWCLSDKQDGYDQIGLNRAENIAIDIVTCQNTSTYNSCLPQEEIISRLYGNRLRVFYNDFTFEPDDYENPLKQAVRYTTPSFTTRMVKQTNFNLGQTTYVSDNGWLIKDIRSESRVTVDSITQFFEDREVMGSTVKRVYLRAITNNETITRTYDKFPDVFPRWNAIFTLLLILSKIICDSYNRFKAQEKLVRDVFFLKDKNVQRLRKLKSLKRLTQIHKDQLPSTKNLLGGSNTIIECEKDKVEAENQYFQKINSDSMLNSEIKAIKDHQPKEDHKHQKDFAHKNLKRDNVSKLNLTNRSKKKKRNSLQINSKNSQNSIIFYHKSNSLADLVEDIKLDIEETPIKDQNNDSDNAACKIEKTKKTIEAKSSTNPKKISDLDDHEIGFFVWLFSQVRQTKRYKVFIKRSEVIQKEFNFQNYAKRFLGIDLLKYFILTKEQQIVFDNCVKAYVNLKIRTSTDRENELNELESEDLRILLNNKEFDENTQERALEKLRAKMRPDERTHKILDLLNIMFPCRAEVE